VTSGARFSVWAKVLTDGRELSPCRVQVGDGAIVAIEPSAVPHLDDLVVEDGWLAPGLIDLQVNGAGGVDLTCAPDPSAALRHVSRILASHGVTSFCPTIVTSPPELILDRLVAYGPCTIEGGAEAVGLHVEGPFIDVAHRGVHDPRLIREPKRTEIDRWLAAARPRVVTLAPEVPGALEVIQYLTANGVIVSLGHSSADAACAQAGIAAGARMATHLFNGMPPLHHRAPGLVGAVLASQLTFGLIADGVHLDPLMLEIVIRTAGVDRVALVSDALASAGVPPGEYTLGEQRIVSDGVSVRRTDGTLAGSAMLLDGCLRNLRNWLRARLEPARLVQMATETPANALALSSKGRVAVGCDADLVVLDDEFNVKRTWVRGESVVA
jgi:N-acetylglucosamine-6-phosphate deacetylase